MTEHAVVIAGGGPTGGSSRRVRVVSELATMDEPRNRLAGISSGLDIRYDLGEAHPCSAAACPIWTS